MTQKYFRHDESFVNILTKFIQACNVPLFRSVPSFGVLSGLVRAYWNSRQSNSVELRRMNDGAREWNWPWYLDYETAGFLNSSSCGWTTPTAAGSFRWPVKPTKHWWILGGNGPISPISNWNFFFRGETAGKSVQVQFARQFRAMEIAPLSRAEKPGNGEEKKTPWRKRTNESGFRPDRTRRKPVRLVISSVYPRLQW